MTKKKDFSEAKKVIESINLNEYNFNPNLKTIYSKRIEAMQAQQDGKFDTKNILIKEILQEINNYVKIPSNEIDSVLKLENINDILKNKEYHYIVMHYYYRTQLEGYEIVEKSLDSLQKTINGNQDFFDIKDWLKKQDFMEFHGF